METLVGLGRIPHCGPMGLAEEDKLAVSRALEQADSSDVVLLAGKGHETYQIRGTTKEPFDEKEIVRELLTAH